MPDVIVIVELTVIALANVQVVLPLISRLLKLLPPLVLIVPPTVLLNDTVLVWILNVPAV